MVSLADQLRGAWKRSGLTLERLRRLAALDCSADSLSRKLSGNQILTTAEAEALALALKKCLRFPNRARA